MRTPAAVIVLSLAAGCGGSSGDRCVKAYQKMAALEGGTGGAGYGAVDFGIACALDEVDLACVGDAREKQDLRRCFGRAPDFTRGDAEPLSRAAIDALVDEACACEDSACLVRFGKRLGRGPLARLMASEPDPATERRFRTCIAGIP